MSRTVVNEGPLKIVESQTRSGKKVYRFFTRNATNSICDEVRFKKIIRAMSREARKAGIIKDRKPSDAKYRDNHRQDINKRQRERHSARSEAVNKRRRELYALKRRKQDASHL